MRKILLCGNPNVGKSTLFNSLTKSSEHTGNFHGVTVEEKSKIIKFQNEEIEFIDLPGIYSLNTFSMEEEVSKKFLINSEYEILVLIDINTIRKNLYLCQQLNELNINYKILINNFSDNKANLKFDIQKFQELTKKDVFLINAKKYKINNNLLKKNVDKNLEYSYLTKYIEKIKNKYNISEKTIIKALNGIYLNLNEEQIDFIKSVNEELISDRYKHIDEILLQCLQQDKTVYGLSKLDKFLLNPFIATLGFLLTFFIGFYTIFFLLGPMISLLEEKLFNFILINPFMNLLYMVTDNIWIIEFFSGGIFASISTVISFVPQVCLMFMFLTILEDSGIISRLAYVFDDLLNGFSLNGKSLYVMLLGFGCNTMSTTATRTMSDKNLRIKSSIINPYFSCMARLPVYSIIASAFFGKLTFFIVFGLYAFGVIVALILALILNKTILKSKSKELLLEFPPLKGIDIKHIIQVGRKNAVDFFKRIFTIILSVGIIIWILTHTEFNLAYTSNISNSILFFFADKISFLFKPIGLNSPGVVCALIVGILAKEMIVSTMGICNNTHTQKELISSLSVATSVISFSVPSAISFLIFSLLYSPCVSNLAVIKRETGKFYMWFCFISQFTIAYILSFLVYLILTKGIAFSIVISIVITLILFSALLIIKKVKQNKCLTCGKCSKF